MVEGLAAPLVRAIPTASHKMGDTTRLWFHMTVKKGPADEGGDAGAETAYWDEMRSNRYYLAGNAVSGLLYRFLLFHE